MGKNVLGAIKGDQVLEEPRGKENFFLLGETKESFMSQVAFELGEENKAEIRCQNAVIRS